MWIILGESGIVTHIKVDRSPGQVWVVNFSAQPVEVRVVCEVFCCQESQLDWPVDSTRTETRRLQSLLLGTRRLQLQSLLLLGARRLQSLLLRTRRLQCLLLLRATRAHLTMWGTLCHHKKKKKNILWQQMSRRTAVCLKNKIIKMSFTYFSW